MDWATWPRARRRPGARRAAGSAGRRRDACAQRSHADPRDCGPGAAAVGDARLRLSRRERRTGQAAICGRRSARPCQNLGIVWGLFSVMVIVAGSTALHAVYTGAGPTYLGVSHYSQIESIPVAGQVLGPAFPGALGVPRAAVLLARSHRRGVHDADLRVADDDLLLPGHGAAELALHAGQHARSRSCSPSGSRCRRCSRRSGSCRRCSRRFSRWSAIWCSRPSRSLVILYFVTRPAMGEFRAEPRPQCRAGRSPRSSRPCSSSTAFWGWSMIAPAAHAPDVVAAHRARPASSP